MDDTEIEGGNYIKNEIEVVNYIKAEIEVFDFIKTNIANQKAPSKCKKTENQLRNPDRQSCLIIKRTRKSGMSNKMRNKKKQ